MPRPLSVEHVDALAARVKHMAYFVWLDWPAGAMGYWSGPATLTTADLREWQGVGAHGAIEGLGADRTGVTDPIRITLHGITATGTIIAELKAAAGAYQNRDAEIHLGFLDANWQLIGDLVPVFVGRMDVMTWSLGKTISAELVVATGQGRSRLTPGWEATPTMHRRRVGDPGDSFYDLVDRLMSTPQVIVS